MPAEIIEWKKPKFKSSQYYVENLPTKHIDTAMFKFPGGRTKLCKVYHKITNSKCWIPYVSVKLDNEYPVEIAITQLEIDPWSITKKTQNPVPHVLVQQ